MQRFFRPYKTVWFLGHVIIFLLGIIVVYAPLISNTVGDAIAGGVGASLIAAGVAGYILYLYVSLSEDDKQRYSVLVHAGLINAFNARSVVIREEYASRIRDATEIDMIGFGLAAFRQDYGGVFTDWKKKKVRILLLDPDFPNKDASFAVQRDREEKNEPGRISGEVNQFINDVREICKEGVFEVRLMRALPSVNYFRLDQDIFWGPYLINGPSRNSPTFLVRGGYLAEALKSHFNALWLNHDLSRKF